MNKNSERTKQWIRNNPERYKANQTRSLQRKETMRKEAMLCIKKAQHKTPMLAIKAFCRACPNGVSRQGTNYRNAPVSCKQKTCPLFPFRNGNPTRIKQGLKRNMVALRGAIEK